MNHLLIDLLLGSCFLYQFQRNRLLQFFQVVFKNIKTVPDFWKQFHGLLSECKQDIAY